MQCPECFAEFEFSLKKYLHWKPSCDHCGIRFQQTWKTRDEFTHTFYLTVLLFVAVGLAYFGVKYQLFQTKGWMESSSLPFWYFFVAGNLFTFGIFLTHGFIKYRTVYSVYRGLGPLWKESVKKLPVYMLGNILAITASTIFLVGFGPNKDASLTAFSGCPKFKLLPKNVSIGLCKLGVRYTLAFGANPNHTNYYGKISPLGMALINKNYDVVELLLDAGSDVMQEFGEKPKSVPMSYAVQDTRYLDRFIKLAGGHDVLLPPRNLNLLAQAIMVAESPKFNREVILKLMDSGLNINKPTGEPAVIPFLLACSFLDAKMIEELISQGGDVQKIGENKVTPAYFASINKDPDVMQVLIRHGASINTQTKFGMTPLLKAREEGNEEVVKILEQHLSQ